MVDLLVTEELAPPISYDPAEIREVKYAWQRVTPRSLTKPQGD